MKKPLVLMILDGFGLSDTNYGNAIRFAQTPHIDSLYERYPYTQLGASGLNVGLPDGQMGNSEVGHTNIGAGRVVYQELTRITKSIQDKDFFENALLLSAMEHCKKNNSALHLMGLLSDGGVHSHIDHLFALLDMAKNNGLEKVYVHCFLDGRDVPPSSGKGFIEALQNKLNTMGNYKIATIMGRYYAMDRDNRWDRVEKAYNAIVNGEGVWSDDPALAVANSYAEAVSDEFVMPIVSAKNAGLTHKDSVIFYNFRPDRARELTRTLVDEGFAQFNRTSGFIAPMFVCMTQYDSTMPNVQVAFKPQSLSNTFGEYIAEKGLHQLRIAETEKYAHVTFFFNGGVEAACQNEDRALIPSPEVATYDLKPSMSAREVTDELLKRLDTGIYDVIILNYANCDMVGHTGVFNAAVEAVETVDTCVGIITEKILAMGGRAILTADHGNADQMYEKDGSPFTAHTTNPVPCIFVGMEKSQPLREGGILADLAPTMLELLGLTQPPEMTGKSLLL